MFRGCNGFLDLCEVLVTGFWAKEEFWLGCIGGCTIVSSFRVLRALDAYGISGLLRFLGYV